ncbi:MAG: S1 RNA-binding domain-containing protein [Planctomycetes bacterium]|nr:S1 RNA-binding domain-containing protein [Planctomycetota bacterium]
MSDVLDPGGQPDIPQSRPVSNPTPDQETLGSGAESASPSMAAIDREVAEAMASMDANDLKELCGEMAGVDAGTQGETLEPNTELVGTVVGVSEDDVHLEFGPKAQGIVSRSQFGKKEVLDLGRRVDVVVERYDSENDLLIVNRKGSIQRAAWTTLAVGALVDGRVIGMNKGGLEVDLHGIRAFMPASHVDTSPMKDISVFLNEKVRCEVIELDRRNKNVLVSRRKVLDREAAEAREKLKAELKEGQTRRGIVGTITDYGAFVDLGGIDGLVHIRDISWGTVERVTDVLKVGQEVEVRILKIDPERDRVSLGLKQCGPDPWAGAEERYPVGTAVKVRVVRLASFGVFAELETGVEGLIPISEMGWSRVERPSDVVSVGAMVDVVVIRAEPGKRRIALSIKQAQKDPWDGVLESFQPQSLITGRVTRLADFGVFVELVPGIEGLIHISELSDRRVKSCSEVAQVGQEIEARILGVDGENRRISLSVKAVSASVAGPPSALPPSQAPSKLKKRKKPLRGGLASHFDW